MDPIAHRGCAGQYPENTLRAIRESAPHVEYIELDVRRCGSGELVVFHDARLDEKTDVTGPVGEMSWPDLRDLTVMGTEERIPLLREALGAFPDDMGVELDVKTGDAATESVEIAREVGVEALVLSGERSTVSAAAEALDVPVGYIIDRDRLDVDVQFASETGCGFVYVTYEICADLALIEWIHGAGLNVNAGVIREADEADRYVDNLREAGVDYLSVDRWDFV